MAFRHWRPIFFSLFSYEVIFYYLLICISYNIGLYCFKYFSFFRRIQPSRVNSSTSYTLFVNACRILNGPSHLGDHFSKVLSFVSMGRMTFQTMSPNLKVFDLTFLLYALAALFFVSLSHLEQLISLHPNHSIHQASYPNSTHLGS